MKTAAIHHLANVAYTKSKNTAGVLNSAASLYKSQQKLAKKSMDILRVGDRIDVASNTSNKPRFSSLVDQFLIPATKEISKVDKVADQVVKGRGDIITAMATINEAEILLQQVIAVRDRFIAAYQDLIKTPL